MEIVKIVQQQIKKYYNAKRSRGLDFKEGDKVQLLHKNFRSRQLLKKLDYVKLGPFIILRKILKVIYKLDLPKKIKIYLVQYIIMLKLVYRNMDLLVYKADTYRGQEEDKWQVLKIVSYKDINNKIQYKVKWIGYNETTWELLENLKNAISKVQEYWKRLGQAILKKKSHLRGTQEEQLPRYLQLFPLLPEKSQSSYY